MYKHGSGQNAGGQSAGQYCKDGQTVLWQGGQSSGLIKSLKY